MRHSGKEITWVASQMLLKLLKCSLTFSTPYLPIIVLSTNLPIKYFPSFCVSGNYIEITQVTTSCKNRSWNNIIAKLTNLFHFSLEHCCLICNAKLYQVTIWIKLLWNCIFKFLQASQWLSLKPCIIPKVVDIKAQIRNKNLYL